MIAVIIAGLILVAILGYLLYCFFTTDVEGKYD